MQQRGITLQQATVLSNSGRNSRTLMCNRPQCWVTLDGTPWH